MAITLTPLINEILRFVADFPHLAEQLNQRIQDLSDSTRSSRSRRPSGNGSIR